MSSSLQIILALSHKYVADGKFKSESFEEFITLLGVRGNTEYDIQEIIRFFFKKQEEDGILQKQILSNFITVLKHPSVHQDDLANNIRNAATSSEDSAREVQPPNETILDIPEQEVNLLSSDTKEEGRLVRLISTSRGS